MPKIERFYLAYDRRRSGVVRYCTNTIKAMAEVLGVSLREVQFILDGEHKHPKYDIVCDTYKDGEFWYSRGQLYCDQLPPLSVSVNKL